MPHSIVFTSLLSILAGLGSAANLGAQSPAGSTPDAWNEPQTLALIERGREARTAMAREGDLETYHALAEGHVYFFLDPDVGERSLIRVDQVAVELGWRAPGRMRQHIVGERSETRLPVRDFDYYLDRVTLVRYGFGDEIRIGSGRDVAGVPHPLARNGSGRSEPAYDFRLADSLNLTLPQSSRPVRLYEIDVRPRDPERPGVLGTLTLDGGSGQIVRMAFTFTPASYVDPRTDWISVELDYGLWEEQYWLPHVQRIEVRREMPEIDLGVGTVIRSVLRVGGYELNVPFDDPAPLLAPVTRAPDDQRLRYPFREGLYAALRRDGLADLRLDTSVRELRADAAERLNGMPPSALSPLRLHLPGPSTLLRYSRAEGAVPGLGGTLRPAERVRIRGLAGYSMGRSRLQGELAIETALSPGWTLEADAHLRTTGDLGLTDAIDPLLSSLATAVRGEDYRDPFHRTGARAGLTFRPGSTTRWSLGVGVDRIENAHLASSSSPIGDHAFRPIRPVAGGTFTRLELDARLPLALPADGRGWLDAGVGLLSGGPGRGIRLETAAETRWGPASGEREAVLGIRGWHWWGDPLPQGHRLLGGRGTLPGFPFRTFAGRHAIVGSAEAAMDAGTPFLRLRAGLHAGWAGHADPEVAEAWQAGASGGLRASASLGVGVFWDLLRIDVARGLNGGEWQLLLAVNPAWWDRL